MLRPIGGPLCHHVSNPTGRRRRRGRSAFEPGKVFMARVDPNHPVAFAGCTEGDP